MADDDDMHMRHQVVESGFSPEDDQLHAAALETIRHELAQGRTFAWLEKNLRLKDPEILRIALDDFLKIAIAERHFNGKESLKVLAKSLRVDVARLVAAKKEMLEDVKDASIKVYHLTKEMAASNHGPTDSKQH
ncbi:MAG: hypothetical protein HQL66_08330 [Magnetococcales bacterium]|nr:hypothetical protein [Magnetococcales bacterium]